MSAVKWRSMLNLEFNMQLKSLPFCTSGLTDTTVNLKKTKLRTKSTVLIKYNSVQLMTKNCRIKGITA